MSDAQRIRRQEREIPFTIDGVEYRTSERSQTAAKLLRLAGLDPARYDLGEVPSRGHPQPKRYSDDDLVEITAYAQFVSIREKAAVA